MLLKTIQVFNKILCSWQVLGEKSLRRTVEEGTTDPTSNLNPQLALLYVDQWVEMLFCL